MPALILDNTILSTYRTCMRKGYYRDVKGLTTDKKSAALVLGAAVHAGIAAFLRGKSKEDAIVAALAEWKDIDTSNEEEWRTPDRCIQILDFLLEKDKWAGFEVLFLNDKPIVETSFAVSLLDGYDCGSALMAKINAAGYDDIQLSGLVDLVAKWEGSIYCVDHKTTTSIVANKGGDPYIKSQFWDQFVISAQMDGYLFAAKKLLPLSFSGFLINCIGIDKTGRVLLGRQTYSRVPSQLEEYRKNILKIVERILDAKLGGYFEMNPDSCCDYFRLCPYHILCKTPSETRDNFEGMFVKQPWNPLVVRDE